MSIETETDPRIDAETGEVFSDEEDTISAASTVDYDRIKRWVMQRDGKDYIQYAGLLDLLHQVSQGWFEISTHLVQAPTDANGMLAIVEARVELLGTDEQKPSWGAPKRQACGLGDASPQSVNRMMGPHLVRLAETRAKGRALRDLLNIPLVTVEELGPGGPVRDEPPAPDPRHPLPNAGAGIIHPAPDTLTVEGKTYTRDQLWGFYQQRRTQCRERNITFPQPPLQRTSDLRAIAEQTRMMRDSLNRPEVTG